MAAEEEATLPDTVFSTEWASFGGGDTSSFGGEDSPRTFGSPQPNALQPQSNALSHSPPVPPAHAPGTLTAHEAFSDLNFFNEPAPAAPAADTARGDVAVATGSGDVTSVFDQAPGVAGDFSDPFASVSKEMGDPFASVTLASADASAPADDPFAAVAGAGGAEPALAGPAADPFAAAGAADPFAAAFQDAADVIGAATKDPFAAVSGAPGAELRVSLRLMSPVRWSPRHPRRLHCKTRLTPLD